MNDVDVLIRVVGAWGHITLNRPRALNALSYPMCCAIDDALSAWEQDSTIIGVLIDGAGERGFCAGGDIRALFDTVRAGNAAQAAIFFAREYRLNARIARFAKPYVALMDGITMGGGVGLSAHGSFRVVTERTMVAMPEVGIGFIPDIGATYLLGRVADGLGIHVALTAMRLNAADAIAIDLADVCVSSSMLDEVRQRVLACRSAEAVKTALHEVAMMPDASRLIAQRDWIKQCYELGSIEQILDALERAGEPARVAKTVIAAQSPTSIKLTLRALRAARDYGALEPSLQLEYRLALGCLRGHDFVEGVRAAVVDKDRMPRWQPDTLADVDDAMLEPYFAALGAAELRFDR